MELHYCVIGYFFYYFVKSTPQSQIQNNIASQAMVLQQIFANTFHLLMLFVSMFGCYALNSSETFLLNKKQDQASSCPRVCPHWGVMISRERRNNCHPLCRGYPMTISSLLLFEIQPLRLSPHSTWVLPAEADWQLGSASSMAYTFKLLQSHLPVSGWL